jgi:hypothetical protein
VSLAPRNPALGWGDAWEQKVLMGFDERVAKGEKADGMEQYEVVNEPSGKFLRYMRALPDAGRPACTATARPTRSPSRSAPSSRTTIRTTGAGRGAGQGARRGHLQEAACSRRAGAHSARRADAFR